MNIPDFLLYLPTVYCVRNHYEIIFITKETGAGALIIDGKRFTDNVCGVVRSASTVHRIDIERTILDSAGHYTVEFKRIPERHSYYPQTVSTEYAEFAFHPLPSNGDINCYILTDTHSHVTDPTKVGEYFGKNLHMLILGGDIGNTASNEDSALTVARLASNLAKGELPVIYLRGNHDTRGAFAEFLPNYVGTDRGRTYFPIRIGKLWGVVLDAGEDKPDDDATYGDIADYTAFRDEQTAMLEELIKNADNEYAADGVSVRLALCHVPFSVMQTPFTEVFQRWTDALNRMGIHLLLGGHTHRNRFLNPGETTSGEGIHQFSCAICSHIDRNNLETYIGTAMTVREDEIILRFTDIGHHVLEEHRVSLT